MPTYQVTFIFNGERQGWAETWYWTGSSSDTAMAAALAVGQARLKLLGNTLQLEAIRVSDVAILGDSFVDESLNNQNTGTGASGARDVVAVSVLGRATAQNLYRRQVWIRGMPDAFVFYDPKTGKSQLNESAAFISAWNTWASQLIAKAYQLRVIDKDSPQKPITGVLVAPVTGQTAIRCPGHGYAPGKMIRIRGAKFANGPGETLDENGKSLVNGVWQVREIVNNPPPAAQLNPVDWFEIPSFFDDIQPAYVSGGKAQERVVAYKTIDFMKYSRYAKRDTGRAFFVPRGRSRGKKRFPQ